LQLKSIAAVLRNFLNCKQSASVFVLTILTSLNMKTVSIGDTHGIAVADFVQKIINDHDKFIFAGDYVDSISP
jgi:hypothetical protein